MPPATLDTSDVRHLARRLAFASTPALERELRGKSADAALGILIAASKAARQPAAPPVAAGVWRNSALRYTGTTPQDLTAMRAEQLDASRRDIEQLRQWWLRELISSPAALRENLALFFHGVFGSTTSSVYMPQALHGCNALVRGAALGTIPALLEQLVLDPAMMIQIGMDEHRKERISDRPAKLILDHWTVGAGHYADDDVEQVSRALTGWVLVAPPGSEPQRAVDPDADRAARRTGLHPRFDASEFDSGPKTILGVKRDFDARAAVRHLAGQPATGRRYAQLLVRHLGVEDPQHRLEEQLATTYQATGGSIEALLRSAVGSNEFWSDATRWALIKSPVHLASGACRQLGVPEHPVAAISEWLTAAGQTLFDTPNGGEGGWRGQEDWVAPPDRLAIRYQLPVVLAGRTPRLGLRPPSASAPASPGSPDDVPVAAELRRASAAVVLERLDPAPGFDATGIPRDALIGRVMATAQYQLA